MYGPAARGHWTSHGAADFAPFRSGKRYRVVKPFVDFDGVTHPVGEAWTFLGSNFLPYDAGLSLFVSLDGEQEWHFRMQDYPESQGDVIARFVEYVVEIA